MSPEPEDLPALELLPPPPQDVTSAGAYTLEEEKQQAERDQQVGGWAGAWGRVVWCAEHVVMGAGMVARGPAGGRVGGYWGDWRVG